jgi:prolyl 4-hydroxylase
MTTTTTTTLSQHPFFTRPIQPRPAEETVYTILPGFLSPEECDYLIRLSHEKGFTSSTVRNYDQDSQYRISETCWIKPYHNNRVADLYDKVEKLCGYEKHWFEDLQVVHYTPGGYFRKHFDQCDTTEEYCKEQVQRFKGYRLYTILMALNDNFEGGGTLFHHDNQLVRLKRGDALIFQNVYFDPQDPTKCIIEPRSMHEGIKLETGDRYIATVWVRGNAE